MKNGAIFSTGKLLGASLGGNASQIKLIFNGGSLTAYLDGLTSFLYSINRKAVQGEKIFEPNKNLSNMQALDKAVFNFTLENCEKLIAQNSLYGLQCKIVLENGNITLCSYAPSFFSQHGTKRLANISQAVLALAELKGATNVLAICKAQIDIQYRKYEDLSKLLRCMEANLAQKICSAKNTDTSKEFMMFAKEQLAIEAKNLMNAQGKHDIEDVIVLLRQ